MRFRQIIASTLTVACLCTCFTTTVSAEAVSAYSFINGVSPLYDIADRAYSELNIVGTKAECVSKASGDNTVKISVEQTLQKYTETHRPASELGRYELEYKAGKGIKLDYYKLHLNAGYYGVTVSGRWAP